jgi:hypothetical protein
MRYRGLLDAQARCGNRTNNSVLHYLALKGPLTFIKYVLERSRLGPDKRNLLAIPNFVNGLPLLNAAFFNSNLKVHDLLFRENPEALLSKSECRTNDDDSYDEEEKTTLCTPLQVALQWNKDRPNYGEIITRYRECTAAVERGEYSTIQRLCGSNTITIRMRYALVMSVARIRLQLYPLEIPVGMRRIPVWQQQQRVSKLLVEIAHKMQSLKACLFQVASCSGISNLLSKRYCLMASFNVL